MEGFKKTITIGGYISACLVFAVGAFFSMGDVPSIWAADNIGPDKVQSQNLPSMPELVARVIFWLVLITVLVCGLVYLLKKLSVRESGGGPSDRIIQVLDKTLIAPKKAIYLVKIAGKVTALGVTDSQINMLAELPSEEILAVYAERRPNSSFVQELKRKLGIKGERTKSVATAEDKR